jgi:hypothetical protein
MIKSSRRKLFAIILIPYIAVNLWSETTVSSTMNWQTGRFSLTAARALGEGAAPDDHPRELSLLEREITPYLADQLGNLPWDYRDTLKDLMSRSPSTRTSLENLAGSLEKEWSRLSDDYTAVEAQYFVDLGDRLAQYFPPESNQIFPEPPIGWTPIPRDGWTGIVVYVPEELPLRGTGLLVEAKPALRARILSDELEVLYDPGSHGSSMMTYLPLEDRTDSEDITGRRPYRTMARGVYGEFPCDIIISQEDRDRIMATESGRRSLAEGRIVVLMDRLPN